MAQNIDVKARLCLAANLRKIMWEYEFPTAAALGRKIGVTRSAVTKYLNGTGVPGLDIALKVHRKLGKSLDQLLDGELDKKWYDPDHEEPPRRIRPED